MIEARVVSAESYQLAEGPVWDDATQTVLWVDIPTGRVLRGELHGEQLVGTDIWAVDGTAGAVVPAQDGRLLVAAGDHVEVLSAGDVWRSDRLLADGRRFNDGGCDPAGRFLVGTVALRGRDEPEALYRYEAGGLVLLAAEVGLSNGLGWSPDGRSMYHADTSRGRVWRYDYDVATGTVGGRELLVAVTDPDGLCVDVEGRIWVALWGGGEVRCFSPSGELVQVISVPAPHTTSVAFVGPQRDQLLITTAYDELSEEQLDEFPLSGRLFLADPGTRGVPTAPWSGGQPG